MKKLTVSLAVLITTVATAQVGIYNDTPEATLDITAKKGTTPDGVLVPRLTVEEARNMSGDIKESTF